jgi:hypothetical protein
MKNMLTTQINSTKKIPSNNFCGVSRVHVSGIFCAQSTRIREDIGSNAPVSAYGNVCGKRPQKLVDNTGAFSMSRESLRNNICGGSKMSDQSVSVRDRAKLPADLQDEFNQFISLLSYHAICIPLLVRDAYNDDEDYGAAEQIYSALFDLEQKAKQIQKQLGESE